MAGGTATQLAQLLGGQGFTTSITRPRSWTLNVKQTK